MAVSYKKQKSIQKRSVAVKNVNRVIKIINGKATIVARNK